MSCGTGLGQNLGERFEPVDECCGDTVWLLMGFGASYSKFVTMAM